MAIIKASESILSIMLMILLGSFLNSRHWFDGDCPNLLVKLVVNISLPALMIYNMMSNFGKDDLLTAGNALIVPSLSMLLCYLMSIFVAHILNINSSRRGAFRSMFFNSNTIFMGLPINMALFGEKSLPYVLFYYVVNSFFFWTLGVSEIKKDGTANGTHTPAKAVFSIDTVRKILSPPLIGLLAALMLILLNINLPDFLMDTLKNLGNLTTPLSMIFIGITISAVNIRNIRFNKEMAALLMGRFIIAPLTILLLSNVFYIPKLMRDVFVIQAAMPVMTNTAIISKAYGADSEYVAIMITLTTLAILLVIPLYMFVLNYI
ncbi:Auxin Efflux Carrier [Tepidanaerobacter acetatoxydans Re1]|uniref:Auxin Efflux Carrier n=1 Tax=Tepidanaerobacter acetatoxydans (strain DSM 21804 / JCM 16047 / Re1) TaxID=1209989 RepID=F4LRS2_TEPAE|nr:AEC family transporter [Tepidanaerobacter acetatoxydans]AEE91140.1 Auxin Efflux Carrier [Tepidanaerobacter acetatoxydans Re1]CDI40568.1 Auxin Efflux Carrier [Tepidanaerobacter acetatoxydans Re1]